MTDTEVRRQAEWIHSLPAEQMLLLAAKMVLDERRDLAIVIAEHAIRQMRKLSI